MPEVYPHQAERANSPSGRRFRFIGERKVMQNLHKITDITKVYGTPVIIKENPATNTPFIIPLAK